MRRILSGDIFILFLSSFLLISSPWVRAGNLAMPAMLLELAGALLLLFIFYSGRQKGKLSLQLWLLIVAVFLVTLLFLVPVPIEVWRELPGRESYMAVFEWVAEDDNYNIPNWLAPSIVPSQTIDAILVLIPLVAIFVAVSTLKYKYLMFLVYVFLGVVFVQSFLGCLQFSSGNFYIFYEQHNTGNAQGSYPNRDHFSALMVMGLFIAIYLMKSHYFDLSRDRGGLFVVSDVLSSKGLFFYIVCITLILLSIIFAASRAGIFLMFLGLVLWLGIENMKRRSGGVRRYVVFSFALLIISLIVFLDKQIIPVINRFIRSNPIEDGRSEIFSNALVAIKVFFPLGSGPGTFPHVYPQFQTLDQAGTFINNAHNDYLELIFETGGLGIVVLILFFILYVARWKELLLRRLWRQEEGALLLLHFGAGLSTLLFLLHAVVDFNFHIFANMIYFTFLLAIFFYRGDDEKCSRKQVRLP